MNNEDILASVLIFINIGAAFVYGWYGNIPKCVYWLAAATLTTVVTYYI